MRFQESNLSGRLLGDSTAPGPTCSRFRASWERRFCLCRAELEHGRTLRALGTAPGRALGETQHGAGERQRFAEDAWKVQPEGLHEQRWERFPRTPKKLKRGRTAELRAAHQWPHVHETGAAAGARWVRGTCAAPAHLLSSSGEQSHGINPQVAHIARGGEGGAVLAFSPRYSHKPPGTGDGHGCVMMLQPKERAAALSTGKTSRALKENRSHPFTHGRTLQSRGWPEPPA